VPKSVEFLRKSVAAVLDEKGLNQKDLAQIAQMTPQQISKLLKGKYSPNLESVDKLAAALGVSSFYLLMPDDVRAKWELLNKASGESLSRVSDALETLKKFIKH
jgi:transcriptional regulator with XRE-family HTH domain